MNKNVLKLIEERYESLSKTHKKLANYIQANIHDLPFLSINELGDRAGVSIASITRFTREISFAGYADFQRSLSQLVQKDITPFHSLKSLIQEDSNGSFLMQTIKNNAYALDTLYNENLEKSFEIAIQKIQKARKIYIIASRSSYSVGYYIYFMLQRFLDNVCLINGVGDLSNHLLYVEKTDCLIAVSYTRYTKTTYKVVNHFFSKGCNVISITDTHTSPIALKSSQILLAQNTASYSLVGAMTLANCLVAALAKANLPESLERMKQQDQIALENGIYL
jgi:DNA-binding MurR/RpiR family transcriptional regulator